MTTKLAFSASALLALGTLAQPALAEARNVILVHGAVLDGSGWRAVHDILVEDGYAVTVAQLPLTSFEADVLAVRLMLDRQDGPVVLVGHSYGGVVITQAGTDPDVAALVYVAAFQPDVGESAFGLIASMSAMMAPDALLDLGDGFIIANPARFHEGFGADLPTEVTDFMAASQAPTLLEASETGVTEAAWRDKPSYGVVATQDRAVSPDLQRFMYKRSGATVTEVEASHMVQMSQPQAVADVIAAAARAVE